MFVSVWEKTKSKPNHCGYRTPNLGSKWAPKFGWAGLGSMGFVVQRGSVVGKENLFVKSLN